MKNKLSIIAICITGLLLSNASYSSDMRDFEPVPHTPSFKKVLVLGLLASAGISHAQELPSYLLNPYKELNMSAYLRVNYEGDMPEGPRATPKYSYNSGYPGNGAISTSIIYAFYDTYCLMQQAKVERAFEMRKMSYSMYRGALSQGIPAPDKYSMIASAINIELASHMLEMEAAKFSASSGLRVDGCAIPTPMV